MSRKGELVSHGRWGKEAARTAAEPQSCLLSAPSQGKAELSPRHLRATHHVPWLWEFRPIRENTRKVVLKLQDRFPDPQGLLYQRQSRGAGGRWLSAVS